jgi:hypothetical protein
MIKNIEFYYRGWIKVNYYDKKYLFMIFTIIFVMNELNFTSLKIELKLNALFNHLREKSKTIV